jgi:hypothetical protein
MAWNPLRIGGDVPGGRRRNRIGMLYKAAGWRGSAPRHVIVLLLCLGRPLVRRRPSR